MHDMHIDGSTGDLNWTASATTTTTITTTGRSVAESQLVVFTVRLAADGKGSRNSDTS